MCRAVLISVASLAAMVAIGNLTHSEPSNAFDRCMVNLDGSRAAVMVCTMAQNNEDRIKAGR